MWNKKGQTATEYLIILAVVIVIALVVVVAMGRFPGMGQGAADRGSQAYWATQDIAFTAYSDGANSDLTINARNNMRNTIEITSFEIGGEALQTRAGSPGAVLASGAAQTFTTSEIIDCENPGDAFSYSVAINYTDRATEANYTFTGGGAQLEGICAN